eukprot:2598536-Pyramimonas_sp.AAC.1
MDDNPADTHPSASEVAATAPEPDYWERRGYCITRHIRTPRGKLFMPTEDVMNIPVPDDQLDVTRDFETTSTFEGEGVLRDVRDGVSAADHRELNEPWAGLVRFYELRKMLPDGKMVVRGRETRVQITTRPDRTLPEHWKILFRGQQKKDIEYTEDIKQARETRERAALRAWIRQDKQAKHFRTTTVGGPTWNTVERRITYDMDSGAVIRDEGVKGVTNKEILYAKLPGGP